MLSVTLSNFSHAPSLCFSKFAALSIFICTRVKIADNSFTVFPIHIHLHLKRIKAFFAKQSSDSRISDSERKSSSLRGEEGERGDQKTSPGRATIEIVHRPALGGTILKNEKQTTCTTTDSIYPPCCHPSHFSLSPTSWEGSYWISQNGRVPI